MTSEFPRDQRPEPQGEITSSIDQGSELTHDLNGHRWDQQFNGKEKKQELSIKN